MRYFLIFLLFFCIACKEQESNLGKIKIIPSKIDSLATEGEIQSFVQKMKYPFVLYRERNDSIKIYKGLEKFELKRIKNFDRHHRKDFDSLTKKIADSLGVNESFYKADIDNNGFTDLIIIGDDKSCSGGTLESNTTKSCNYSVYALMNFGNDSINPVNLMKRDFVNDGIVPKIDETNGRTSLKLFEAPKYTWPDNKKISDLMVTELTYWDGTFVEYNDKPKKYTIEKIEYSAEPCFGSCPIFEMIINKDRKVSLNAVEFNSLEPHIWEYEISRELKGKFNTVIDEKSYQEIIELLNYLDFPTLQEDYSVSATDNPSCKLTITYNQGKTKTINDYGKVGTFGLKKIYLMISNLRTSQEWK